MDIRSEIRDALIAREKSQETLQLAETAEKIATEKVERLLRKSGQVSIAYDGKQYFIGKDAYENRVLCIKRLDVLFIPTLSNEQRKLARGKKNG